MIQSTATRKYGHSLSVAEILPLGRPSWSAGFLVRFQPTVKRLALSGQGGPPKGISDAKPNHP